MNKEIAVLVLSQHQDLYVKRCVLSLLAQEDVTFSLHVYHTAVDNQTTREIETILQASDTDTTFQLWPSEKPVNQVIQEFLKHSESEYVLFVDADKFFVPRYLTTALALAKSEHADLVYSSVLTFGENQMVYASRPVISDDLLAENGMGFYPVIKRNVLENFAYDKQLSFEMGQYDMYLSCLSPVNRLVYLADTALFVMSMQSLQNREMTTYRDFLHVLAKHAHKWDKNTLALLLNRLSVLQQVDSQHSVLQRQYRLAIEENGKLKADIDALVRSKSFRLGQLVMKPMAALTRGVKALLHPETYRQTVITALRRLRNVYFTGQKMLLVPVRQRTRHNHYGESVKRALVFNIFESEPRVMGYKIHFLKALRAIVDTCVIVVNGHLSDADKIILETYGTVVVRANEGYDTAAFREGILYFGEDKLKTYDQLLLVNDTNVGPFYDLAHMFSQMPSQELDFWGITKGEVSSDFTGYNKYGYIPAHLQSYFLVIEQSLLRAKAFYDYWQGMTDTNSRDKAIGKHETVFTKHFSDLGYAYDAFVKDASDSAVYLHPIKILEQNSPIVKFTTFSNFNRGQLLWGGLDRASELSELLAYIKQTDYPQEYIDEILSVVFNKQQQQYILIIDGVNGMIPQCTRYRVLHKKDMLEKHGYSVKVVNAKDVQLSDGKLASHIILYRCAESPVILKMVQIAKETGKPVLYDMDDLVFDTRYTNQLAYTKQLSVFRKKQYDDNVQSYGRLLRESDVAIASTARMKTELNRFVTTVIMSENQVSDEVIAWSDHALQTVAKDEQKIIIGYFSGSITHNENIAMIQDDLARILSDYSQVYLMIVGHLDIPDCLLPFQSRIIQQPYVAAEQLPALIRSVDINLAPLVSSVFNEAKSAIKYIEAALVEVVTVASDIGAFQQVMTHGQTGYLAQQNWYAVLSEVIEAPESRQRVAKNARAHVLAQYTSDNATELVAYVSKETKEAQDVAVLKAMSTA